MHIHGINVFFLMHVFQLSNSSKVHLLLMTEAMARTIKHIVEEKWRLINCQDLSLQEYKAVLVDVMNTLYKKPGTQWETFWQNTLPRELFSRFPTRNDNLDSAGKFTNIKNKKKEMKNSFCLFY